MRWGVFLLVLAVAAGLSIWGAVSLTIDETPHIAAELQPPDANPLDTTCIIQGGSITIDAALLHKGNIVISSKRGDIIVRAPIETLSGLDGNGTEILPPTDEFPDHYTLGESGQDGGDIILLAPGGSIILESAVSGGDGGNGVSAEIGFTSPQQRHSEIGDQGEHDVLTYGGYGGFGGDIYLGAEKILGADGNLFPGAGGQGGNAVIDGASIYDIARGGHGGMAGQAYHLVSDFSETLAERLDEQGIQSASGLNGRQCSHPIAMEPDDRMPATVIQPSAASCRGGDGGHAITYGLFDDSPRNGWDRSIAGVAIGGNGGWGCPGGRGGDATSVGAVGTAGIPGESPPCATDTDSNGGPGGNGQGGGFGGHAFAGDGGAGAPGQHLIDAGMPNPLFWFTGWSPNKSPSYDTAPTWPIVWGHDDGSVANYEVWFPLIGDDQWYVGGDGGIATSLGGEGGRGGPGGDGRNGPAPGEGGEGGRGGNGANAGMAMGGWAGPGAQQVGIPGTFEWERGATGLEGDAGADGSSTIAC